MARTTAPLFPRGSTPTGRPTVIQCTSDYLARAGRTGEIFEFAFSKTALDDPHLARQRPDPDISLFAGPQYPRDRRRHFGIFADASPTAGDGVRSTAVLRRKRTGELPANARLRESDYLLGVS